MLGSTHGSLSTDPRTTRAATCGERRVSPAGDATDLDVGGRPLHASVPDLDAFFRPATVAVIGARDADDSAEAAVTRHLMAWAERLDARMLPVHPRHQAVFGVPCLPSVASLPCPVDLAVVLTADPACELVELAAAQAKFAVVLAPGLKAAEGRRRLADVVSGSGLRLLGPSTGLDAFAHLRDDLRGPAIALVTQHGDQGHPVLALQDLGVRVSHWAVTGDEADLEVADFVTYFAEQPEAGAIAAHVDGLRDGRAFLLAADRAARNGVPVVAITSGRTQAGTRKGTGSRTGASRADGPTGSAAVEDAVADAAFRQFGVIRVDGPDRLRDTAALLARARPPKADGVAVYAPSGSTDGTGGTGAYFRDLATAAGLLVPSFDAEKQAELRRWIPGSLSVANPVEHGGRSVGGRYGPRILDAILADPSVGVLVCPITGPFPPMSDALVQQLVDAAERTDKVVCVVWGSPVGTEAAYRRTLLRSSRVATFRTFGNCVAAVGAHLDHHRFVAGYRSPFESAPRTPSPSARRARAFLRPGQRLSEHEAKRLLRAYGVRVPREHLVTSAAGAVRAAGLVGYPVVMKASGARLAHRSERGLVKLGLTSASQVRDAYRDLADIARHEGVGLDGVLVCQMVEPGIEMAVGVVDDGVFGPAVTVGLGGVFGAALGEPAVRVTPFTEAEARRMLHELPGCALLEGVRGRPPADVDALVDIVLRVQRMVMELGDELTGLDVDPLVVLPRGQGAVALDANAVCR
ncbi:acetate--CoA ligase family protein [Streptantibioticus parmotrematis]|uniref:acetate--CoA ligase family protein n=1 Tax=Streptantibioticus parmotrematis TaxID=2873249 RepID=UPI0033E2B3DF